MGRDTLIGIVVAAGFLGLVGYVGYERWGKPGQPTEPSAEARAVDPAPGNDLPPPAPPAMAKNHTPTPSSSGTAWAPVTPPPVPTSSDPLPSVGTNVAVNNPSASSSAPGSQPSPGGDSSVPPAAPVALPGAAPVMPAAATAPAGPEPKKIEMPGAPDNKLPEVASNTGIPPAAPVAPSNSPAPPSMPEMKKEELAAPGGPPAAVPLTPPGAPPAVPTMHSSAPGSAAPSNPNPGVAPGAPPAGGLPPVDANRTSTTAPPNAPMNNAPIEMPSPSNLRLKDAPIVPPAPTAAASTAPSAPTNEPPMGAAGSAATGGLPPPSPAMTLMNPATANPTATNPTPPLNPAPAPAPSLPTDQPKLANAPINDPGFTPPAGAGMNNPTPKGVPVTIKTQPDLPKNDGVLPVPARGDYGTAPTTGAKPVGYVDSYDLTTYTPRQGETFATLSKQLYGDERYAEAVQAYLEDYDPRLAKLTPGQTISLPPAEVLQRRFGHTMPLAGNGAKVAGNKPVTPRTSMDRQPVAKSPAPPAKPSGGTGSTRSYAVQQRETLYSIAKRTLGSGDRWGEIYNLNKDLLRGGVEVEPGMTLKLPGDAKLE